MIIGHSVLGRGIVATESGDPDNGRPLLVVGVIHGDESAGRSVARRLASMTPRPETHLLIVGAINPDGAAGDTRQNADGVDLNRNFPFRWRRMGTVGDQQYSGPRPLSEPEARAARSLIMRSRPRVTVWFHQPLGLVDESGGDLRVERQFSRMVGLPLRRLTRYPGSAAGWQNHRLRGTTAFVVELPAGRLKPAAVGRFAGALLRLAGEGSPS
jgi:protein MpaA